jgi:hypothetical protein
MFQFTFSLAKSSLNLAYIDQEAFREDNTFGYQGSNAGACDQRSFTGRVAGQALAHR